MTNPVLRFAQWIATTHARFFRWLAARAETKPWFALLLTLMALYEIFEHVLVPTLAFLWATGHLHL